MRYPLTLATFVALACSGATAPVPAAGGADAGSPAGNGADGGGPLAGGSTNTPATGTGLIPATADGWRTLAPRAVSAPSISVGNGADGYVLNASGGGTANVYGGWTTHIAGLQGGTCYRFSGRARAVNIASIRESVTIILRWRGSFGDEVQPDYVWSFEKQQDGSVIFDRTLQAPAGTSAVDVELVLQWSPDGQVAFDKLSFVSAAAPSGRKARVASIYYRPSGTRSGLDSVQQAGRYAGQVAVANHPDVMVLGELLNSIGAPGTFDTNAETVPGPSTDFMSGIARANNVNLVFGMVERAGDVLFNTAVLIDRNGNIAGKYHKVQLPISDAAAGLMPGDSVPVFDTDFGKVALLICQDIWFPEPAREAALKGAELLLVPIWGGKTALVHARAVENGIYLAASGYDYASEVVDPLGSVLASVIIDTGPRVAVADIDLSQRFREQWLGDWRDIANKQRRAEPYQYRLP